MKGRNRSLFKRTIGRDWTLFLDRDGVINRRLEGDYIKTWDEFEFLPSVPDALAIFTSLFNRIVVVTNQQGIGKGLMTEETLQGIHQKMSEAIRQSGGRIDHIFHCPDLQYSGSMYRKPNIGMALTARKLFPDIRFSRSVMAGDSLSDMQFGKNAGMMTVLVARKDALCRQHPDLIDLSFNDLYSFSQYLLTLNPSS